MLSKWDRYGIDQAKYQAKESKDPSSQVGAVILRPDGTLASAGWNGFARRVLDAPMRLKDRETKLALTIHAELNAILSAREPLHGYTLYGWPYSPCAHCASCIVQAGIGRVVAPTEMPDRWRENFTLGQVVLMEAGVEFTRWCEPVDVDENCPACRGRGVSNNQPEGCTDCLGTGRLRR